MPPNKNRRPNTFFIRHSNILSLSVPCVLIVPIPCNTRGHKVVKVTRRFVRRKSIRIRPLVKMVNLRFRRLSISRLMNTIRRRVVLTKGGPTPFTRESIFPVSLILVWIVRVFRIVMFLLFLRVHHPTPFRTTIVVTILRRRFIHMGTLPLPFHVGNIVCPVRHMTRAHIRYNVTMSYPRTIQRVTLSTIPTTLRRPLIVLPFRSNTHVLPIVPSPIPIFQREFRFFRPLFCVFIPFRSFYVLLELFQISVLPLQRPLHVVLNGPVHLIRGLLIVLGGHAIRNHFRVDVFQLVGV